MNAALQAPRIETTLTQDGTLTLEHLPFQAGETVEVIVLPHTSHAPSQDRYALLGTPVDYEEPTEPVAEVDDKSAGLSRNTPAKPVAGSCCGIHTVAGRFSP